MLGLAGSLVPASAVLATGAEDHLPTLVVDEPAIFEQSHRLPALEEKAALKPAIEQAVGVPDIDLDYVQDLRVIIDEARKKAQVEYLAQKLRQPPHTLQKYVQLAWEEASKRAGLRPELLLAIMHKESTFQPKVQSRYGAQGLMQVVRRWHREKLHKNESLFDPEVNVRVGTDVLEEYLEWAEGDLTKALVKYSGNARGYANTVLSESRKLAQVAEMAAAEVAEVVFVPEPDAPAPVADDELQMQAANEQAG
ncbi:MAG TPA: transglycosylase SLT domain-containing protein [Pusillimonas sp.]|uniref:transglycosylase SLT domain-containing protein n=1 Tax=unclassified Pusillimonas TaxID=2640016 RepID=UPI00263A30C8|nr:MULTISPECIES: transglycosylase SLT domain-containing protein [unclassified Pusillimonas]HLU18902.1 transglycosylase SLT domain-containing protein [Pusillimonas sp.]